MKKKRNKLEQEIKANKNEITELKENIKHITNENTTKISEMQIFIDKLKEDQNQANINFQQKLQELESDKQKFVEEEGRKNEAKINEILTKEAEVQNILKEQIRHLQEESNKRTGILRNFWIVNWIINNYSHNCIDEFLKQGILTDQLREQITILKESEARLINKNDWLKEMNDIMQNILKKHEDDNRILAEQLFAFKQQIIESNTFTMGNKKYSGWRFDILTKSEATLYFTEENVGNFKTENEYFLVMEYGSGKAVKIALSKLDEFYQVEGTNQIFFKWPDKKLFKSTRSETFESESAEEIMLKYYQILDKSRNVENIDNDIDTQYI